MTSVKRPGTTSGTIPTPPKKDLGGIHAMYGVVMRTDLNQIASGVKNIKKQIEGALGRHELMGRDLKDATEALAQIKKAVTELEVPGGKVARKAKDKPTGVGGPSAMYGVVIRDNLDQFKADITGLLGRVNRGISTGQFASKTELQDAKQVQRRLENALTMLNTPG